MKFNQIIQNGTLQKIGIGFINIPEYHDRTDVDDETIEKLAQNISEVGLLNPILVVKTPNDEYELISGLRRYKAFCKLVIPEIDAIVLENLSEESKMLVMITENAQRVNLNDYDLVVSLIHLLAVNSNISDEEAKNFLYKIKRHDEGELKVLAIDEKRLRKAFEDTLLRTNKYSLKGLINKLKVLNFHPDIIQAMKNKDLLFSYASMLNKVKDETKMKELLEDFISEKMNKDELKKEIRKILGQDKKDFPLKASLKLIKDFENFSDEKKLRIREIISNLERVLTA